MSATIDQRVVEMRFDNKQFESGVSTTMSTLDKLKQKLNLTGASKGLDDLNKSVKKVDLAPMGAAADAVSARFSHMQMTIQHQLNNIVDSAVRAGKNIVKSLTIDPVKSGFSEYETKMGSIQTILANTEHQGTTLNDVTRALDELNLYADKTIYNFQEMTKNIGTFTAAGVDLDTSVRSIQGIANLAAVSGSTSQQASTAMYQLSQALSSGTVRLQDWNSVVNAGMGGKVFQNALIRTAAMLDGAASDVEAWQKEHIDAYGSFRDSLTQGEWLTTEVLTRTLEQFTMACEEGSEDWEAFKKSLTDDGYTEEQAEAILKMANTATDAATKVKTFTQLMDTLKESAQSGWAQTWELIIGDFEEAKEFFTQLSDIFGGIIGESADRRNTWLGDAMSSNWDKLITKINDAGIETEKFETSIRKVVGDDKLDGLIQDYGSLEKAVREGAISSEVLNKALEAISGNKADSKISSFVEGLKEIESTLRKGDVGDEVKKLQTALDELGYDLGEPGIDGIIGPITEKAIKAFQEANDIVADGIVGPKTLAALEKAGTKVEEVEGKVDDLKLTTGELIDEITKKSGRELLLDSLMNVIKAIQRPLSAVGEAFRNIFSISSNQLYDALNALNKFTKRLVPKGVLDAETWLGLGKNIEKVGVDFDEFKDKLKNVLEDHGVSVEGLEKKYGSLREAFEAGAISFDHIKEALLSFDGITESLLDGGEAADKVRRTFEGLFAALDVVGTILAGPLKLAFKVGTEVLEKLGLSFLDVTASLGDSVVKFRDKIDKVVEGISSFLVENVGGWIAKFKETEFFKTAAGWFESAGNTISDALENVQSAVDNFNTSSLGNALAEVGNFLSNIAVNVGNNEVFLAIVNGIVSAFTKLKDFLVNFKLPEFSLDSLANFSKYLRRYEGADLSSIANIFDKFTSVTWSITSYNWEQLANKALEKFVNFWLKTGDQIVAAFEKCKEVATAIKEFIFGTEEVNLPAILKVAEKFLGIIVLIQALKTMQALVSPFDGIADALNNFASSLKWKAIGSAFTSMAIAIGVLTVCILLLVNLGDDMKKAWSAAGMLVLLMAALGGVVAAITFLSAKLGGSWNTAAVALALVGVMAALLILVRSIKELDELELKHPIQTFVRLGLMIAAFAAAIKIISLAGGTNFTAIAAILTLVAALKMILEVIDAYDAYDWENKTKGILAVVAGMFTLSAAMALMSSGLSEGSSFKGMAFSLLSMVISLKLLVGVIEEFGTMDDTTLAKGLTSVIFLLLAMGTIMTALTFVNGFNMTVVDKGKKAVNSFKGLAVALITMVAAIAILGYMAVNHQETLLKGGAALAAILAALTAVFSIVGKFASGLQTGVIVAMIIGFAILLAELAAIIYLMQDVPWQSALSSAGALAGVLLAMGIVMKILSGIKADVMIMSTWVGLLVVLGLIVAGLAAIIYQMDGIDAVGAIANAGSLAILLGALTGAIILLNKFPVTKGVGNGIIALVAMYVPLIALVDVLKQMSGVEGAIANATALSILVAAAAGVTIVLSKMPVTTSVGTGIVALVAMYIPLLALVDILKQMSGVENAIENAFALSLFAATLSGCVILLAVAGKIAMSGGMVPGVAALVVVAFALAIVVEKLAAIDNVEAARQNAMTLSLLAGVLTVCMMGLAVAGWIAMSGGIAVSALALAGVAAVLTLIVSDLASITDADTAAKNAETLVKLATVLTACVTVLSLVGLLAVGAAVGVAALILVANKLSSLIDKLSKIKNTDTARANADIITDLLKTMGTLILVLNAPGVDPITAVKSLEKFVKLVDKLTDFAEKLGKASSKIEGLESFIDTGLGILKKVAEGLGELILSFTTGLGLGSDITSVAENIAKFADTIQPFVDIANSLNDDVIGRIGKLTESVQTLSAVGETLGGEGSTLATLGTELSTFASNAESFIDIIGGMKPEVVTTTESFCNAVNLLSQAASSTAGTNFSAFGTNVAEFATSLKDVAINLNGFGDDDVENIKRAADAGTAIAELNNAIPSAGGIWQDWIAGGKSLSDWGATISAFADSLVAYSAKVSGKNIDVNAITASTKAATAISDLNNAIPSAGGVWQDWLAGGKNLADWGTTICSFGESLVAYSGIVAGKNIDATAIEASAAAAAALVEVNNALNLEGGVIGWLEGEQDMSGFGTGLVSLAEGIVAYSTAAAEIDSETVITDIQNTAKIIDELKLLVEKLPKVGGASGGLFGDRDPAGFGTGLVELANGMTTMCTAAASLGETDYSTVLTSAKNAMDQIVEIVNSIPLDGEYGQAAVLNTAVGHLRTVCTTLNSISTGNYDYSGLDTLETAITKIQGLLTDIPVDELSGKFSNMSAVSNQVGTISSAIAAINGVTYGGVDTLKGALDSLADANVDGVINAFSGKAEAMTAAVTSVVNAMSSGLSDGGGKVADAASSVADNALNALSDKKSEFSDAGTAFVNQLVGGINKAKSSMMDAGKSAGANFASGVNAKYGSAKAAGEYLGQGLVNGTNSKWGAAYSAGYNLGSAVTAGIVAALVIASPSKVTTQHGVWVGEGLVNGINSMSRAVYKSGHAVGDDAIDGISNSITKISDVINSDIDSQPTIRPVLDLSDVSSGASAINSMLGMGSSIGISANVGAISSMMSRRGQNGAESEVVSAINKLRKDLGNVGGTTYNVNGITYDDGSNVATAVKEIVRAARTERRV